MRYIRFLAALAAVLCLQAATASEAAAQSPAWAWPVRGDVVTRYTNGDDPYAGGQHRGIDIAAPVGTPVAAASGGRVTYAGVAGSSGLTVTVRTSDGRWDVSYLHLSAASVHEGDAVSRGDRLGAVGVSGRRSIDRPHLHFGVREAGSRHAYHDPIELLPPLTSPAPEPQAPADAPATAPAPVPPSVIPAAASPGPAAAAESAPHVASPSAAPASGAAPAPSPLAEPRTGRGSITGHGLSFESGARSAGGLAFERSAVPRNRGGVGAAVTHGARPGAGSSRHAHASAGSSRERPSPDPHVPPARRERGSAAPPTGTAASPHATAPRADPGASSSGAGREFDIGWLAALVGCLAAALCLGRPEATTRAARTGTARVADWLRPLTGRSG